MIAESFKGLGLVTAMKPSGGWRFPQKLPDGQVAWAEGGGAEDLLKDLITIRIENSLPMGQPAEDIAAYIKSVSPANNRGKRLPPQPENASSVRPIVPLIEFMKAWLQGMKKRDVKLVREDEAEARALICAGCPQNVSWRVSCDECNDAIVYASNNLRQKPGFQLDKKLRGCRLHRFPCQSAIFVDRDNLPPRHPQAPTFCWVKNEP